MGKLTSICVYCGSQTGAKPSYGEAARVLGAARARAGIALIYGGGSVGLMGTVARASLAEGGMVVGIIQRFLVRREGLIEGLSEIVVTEDMHTRKQLMFERADAFVALPGGVGTLEELVEQLTWSQLGRHEKPILIANIDGFWNDCLALFAHMRRQEFIRPDLEVPYLVADRAEDIVPMLQRASAAPPAATREEAAAAAPIDRL